MDIQWTRKVLERRTTIVVIGAISLAVLLAWAIWWVLKPTYVALSKEATEASQADIIATLSQWQVTHRINPESNVIEVLEQQLGAARVHLAEAGIPVRTGVGFELFDKADYGMSEFSQRINYQRALEGELARSVMSLREVKFARVHLTLEKSGWYQRAEERAKASVIVRLKPDAALNGKQIQGIQQLVASAVEGMSLENVVLLDEAGGALSASDDAADLPERLKWAERIESALQQKAVSLLKSSFGMQGAQVSVRVLMNFDRVKTVRDQPISSLAGPIVSHEKQQTSMTGGADDAEGKRTQNTREANYVVGKEVSEIERAMGTIERVSVGVVLAAPQSEPALREAQHLLSAALGIDPSRGDQLVVVYMPPRHVQQDPVSAPTPSAAPDTFQGSYRQTWMLWGLGLLSIILALSLLLGWRHVRQKSVDHSTSMRLSADEREQLLMNVRHWLKEGC